MAICKVCKKWYNRLQLRNIEYGKINDKTGECQKCMDKRIKEVLR